MATLQEITMNLEALNNISGPNVTEYTNNTLEGFMSKIPENANAVTNNLYGISVLVIIGFWIYWLITDKGQYGEFRFSSLKGLGITLGIISILGINLLSCGLMASFIHVSILITLFTLILVWNIILEI